MDSKYAHVVNLANWAVFGAIFAQPGLTSSILEKDPITPVSLRCLPSGLSENDGLVIFSTGSFLSLWGRLQSHYALREGAGCRMLPLSTKGHRKNQNQTCLP